MAAKGFARRRSPNDWSQSRQRLERRSCFQLGEHWLEKKLTKKKYVCVCGFCYPYILLINFDSCHWLVWETFFLIAANHDKHHMYPDRLLRSFKTPSPFLCIRNSLAIQYSKQKKSANQNPHATFRMYIHHLYTESITEWMIHLRVS